MKIFYKPQGKINGTIEPDEELFQEQQIKSLWFAVRSGMGTFMKKEQKTVVYDDRLGLEACRFRGMMQPFPNHFHEHYVIGLVEAGRRRLVCCNREYDIGKGSVLLFNPGDSHACAQSGKEALDYRSIHISRERMLGLAEEITGRRELPGFSPNVILDEEIACYLRSLHERIWKGDSDLGREEGLWFLMSALLGKYSQPFEDCVPECGEEMEQACGFMKEHYQDRICLDDICHHAGLGRSSLLRAFTREKGITPYRYLEAIRINEAKRLLEEGAQPIEAAVRTGFSDQSHFTNYFNSFIGLTPGVYREIFFHRNEENINERK